MTHLSCAQERDKTVSIKPKNDAQNQVCVIIAAYNADKTIARAVRSALAQEPVQEVIVVDDASTDNTIAAAHAADDASGRLKIIPSSINKGLAAARNRAIEASVSSLIALLDSDDFYLPLRFEPMLQLDEWDLIADNIAFVDEKDVSDFSEEKIIPFEMNSWDLSFSAFISGNISKRGMPRAELGFLKPVLKRHFLESNRLKYNEDLRLGEDFALYTQMLRVGARFKCLKPCGYVAVTRSDSLSGSHSTKDLEALLRFDDKLSRMALPDEKGRRELARHRRQLETKHHLRAILDFRRENGRWMAGLMALKKPGLVPSLVTAVLRDKLPFSQQAQSRAEVRYLF